MEKAPRFLWRKMVGSKIDQGALPGRPLLSPGRISTALTQESSLQPDNERKRALSPNLLLPQRQKEEDVYEMVHSSSFVDVDIFNVG